MLIYQSTNSHPPSLYNGTAQINLPSSFHDMLGTVRKSPMEVQQTSNNFSIMNLKVSDGFLRLRIYEKVQ